MSESLRDRFSSACMDGDFKLSKELWNSVDTPRRTFDLDFAFALACADGYMSIAQWLWQKTNGRIDLRCLNDYAFRNACKKGHLNMIKWLWSKSNRININNEKDQAFHGACMGGHLDVAKWLLSIPNNNIDILTQIESTFTTVCCYRNDLKMAQWLWDLPHVSDNINKADIYRKVREWNNHDIANWLQSLNSEKKK